MRELRDTTALVTGASRGIGPYIARALAARGVNLVLSARSEAPLTELAASLRLQGVRAIALPADLAVATERVALARSAEAELDGLDILVNNAGIESEGVFIEQSAQAIDDTVAVNLIAPRCTSRGCCCRRWCSGDGVTWSP